MLLFIRTVIFSFCQLLPRFNTSHVVIYHWQTWRMPIKALGFNTSHVVIYHLCRKNNLQSKQRFNTSHVVIYHGWTNTILSICPGFNTSHVVIYRFKVHILSLSIFVSIHLMLLFIADRGQRCDYSGKVSIHLMLLFIWEQLSDKGQLLMFQYISCCYLSGTWRSGSLQ